MIDQQVNDPPIVRDRCQFVLELQYSIELRFANGNPEQYVAERLALFVTTGHLDEHGKLGDRRYDESDHLYGKEHDN